MSSISTSGPSCQPQPLAKAPLPLSAAPPSWSCGPAPSPGECEGKSLGTTALGELGVRDCVIAACVLAGVGLCPDPQDQCHAPALEQSLGGTPAVCQTCWGLTLPPGQATWPHHLLRLDLWAVRSPASQRELCPASPAETDSWQRLVHSAGINAPLRVFAGTLRARLH